MVADLSASNKFRRNPIPAFKSEMASRMAHRLVATSNLGVSQDYTQLAISNQEVPLGISVPGYLSVLDNKPKKSNAL